MIYQSLSTQKNFLDFCSIINWRAHYYCAQLFKLHLMSKPLFFMVSEGDTL